MKSPVHVDELAIDYRTSADRGNLTFSVGVVRAIFLPKTIAILQEVN